MYVRLKCASCVLCASNFGEALFLRCSSERVALVAHSNRHTHPSHMRDPTRSHTHLAAQAQVHQCQDNRTHPVVSSRAPLAHVTLELSSGEAHAGGEQYGPAHGVRAYVCMCVCAL